MERTDDRSPEERRADDEKRAFAELHQAQQRKNILDDPVFKEAVQKVDDGFVRDFRHSEVGDDEARKTARMGLEALSKVVQALNSHVKTGKFAQEKLKEMQNGDAGTGNHH